MSLWVKVNSLQTDTSNDFKQMHSHWVQSKRHGLWFSIKTCSCYTTKTHVNSMILILKLNLTSLRNIYIKSGLR